MEKAAARYATAIFELGTELKFENNWKSELSEINRIFVEDPDSLKFFSRSQITKSEKRELIKQVFESQIDNTLINFMYVLIDADRMNLFPEIIKEFRKLVNDKLNIAEGTVYSVRPLPAEEIKKLEQALSLRNKQSVELSNRLDPTLITGIKVVIGNTVSDGSMKNRIRSLKEELTRGSR